MTLICTTLVEPTAEKMLKSAVKAQKLGTDLIELRLDYIDDFKPEAVADIKERVKVKTIGTVRPQWEGGHSAGSEEDRFELLNELLELKALDYIDLELNSDHLEELAGKSYSMGLKSIVSYHDLKTTPDEREFSDLVKICTRSGDIGKIAVTVNSQHDLKSFLTGCRLCRERKLNFIAVALNGLASRITRILAPYTGSVLTYTSLSSAKTAVPGQLELAKLKEAWSAMGVDAKKILKGKRFVNENTKIYGLIGKPLGHSLSPLMHNNAFKSSMLNSVYLPFEIEKSSLESFISECKTLGITGLNVTIPYKEKTMKYLDDLGEDAISVGAVNTIINENEKLTGFNTDVYGAVQALKSEGVRLKNKKALIIGAGGAAKAVCAGFLNEGAKVSLTNRSPGRADKLKKSFSDITIIDYNSLNNAVPEHDIIINCTPAGTAGMESNELFDYNKLTKKHTVFDLVYNPEQTLLLETASSKGAKSISGINMLKYQAIKAFKLWTGIEISVEDLKL